MKITGTVKGTAEQMAGKSAYNLYVLSVISHICIPANSHALCLSLMPAD